MSSRFFSVTPRFTLIVFCTVLLALASVLSACGDATATYAPAASTTMPSQANEDAIKSQSSTNSAKNAAGVVPAPAAVPAQVAPTAGTSGNAAPVDRKVMRNATMTLAVPPEAVQPAVNTVSGFVTNSGGYLLQSNSVQRDGYTYATMTFQVPFAQFENVLSELRVLPGKGGHVESEQTSGQDVTEEFTDTQSEIRNLQTEEDSLLKLLAQVTKLDDILTLQNKLADVRGQIEKFQGRIKFLSNRTDYSTVTLTINPIIPPPPTPTPTATPSTSINFDAGKITNQAWEGSLNVLKTVATIVLSVVVFGWWLIPLLLIGGYFYRRTHRKPSKDNMVRAREQESAPTAGSGKNPPLG